jgi:predicted RNase H-like nuclease (RuvC/YqgF family)
MIGMTLQHCQEARAALKDELEQAQAENERLAAQLDTATKELVLQSNQRNKAQTRAVRRTDQIENIIGWLDVDPFARRTETWRMVVRKLKAVLAEGDGRRISKDVSNFNASEDDRLGHFSYPDEGHVGDADDSQD